MKQVFIRIGLNNSKAHGGVYAIATLTANSPALKQGRAELAESGGASGWDWPDAWNKGNMTMSAAQNKAIDDRANDPSWEPTGDDLYRLGLAHSTGQDGPLDYVEAHKWFNLAALNGSDAAKVYRKELAEQMTKAQIASAQKAARQWLAARDAAAKKAAPRSAAA